MGGVNAPDVAQTVHLRLLRDAGCMVSSSVLEYGQPLPSGPVFEGVYLDDHGVIYISPKSELSYITGPDRDIIDRSHRAHERANLKRATHKGVGFANLAGERQAGSTRFTL